MSVKISVFANQFDTHDLLIDVPAYTHILEAVYHLTAASVLMCVLCKTHPHPTMHYADSICVSLVQNYEREQREN